MTHYQIGFDYLASDQKVPSDLLSTPYRAVIISDFPAGNFSSRQFETLAQRIREGMGLVMIGGWESFTGPKVEYTHTVMKDILPVVMASKDDRVNCPQPCLIEKNSEHPILEGLPFTKIPPGIGGFNLVKAKPEAATLLSSRRFRVEHTLNGFKFEPFPAADPLLVVGQFGKGRVAAFASDVAPHWVGGLVDWGDGRVAARAEGANEIEVGNWYARFFARMVQWTAQTI